MGIRVIIMVVVEEVFMGIDNISPLLNLLAVLGLLLLFRQMEGPWGIISRWRNAMVRIPIIGKQFYDALQCSYCSGAWAACLIYSISSYAGKLGSAVCFVLAGAAVCLLLNSLLTKVHESPPAP